MRKWRGVKGKGEREGRGGGGGERGGPSSTIMSNDPPALGWSPQYKNYQVGIKLDLTYTEGRITQTHRETT